MSSPIITTSDLTIGYSNKQSDVTIQSNLNLKAMPGEFICLIGPNGCGKSTLLHTLSGLIPPLSGKILINNNNIRTMPLQERAKEMSFVPTEEIDAPLMTVNELVSLGRSPYTGWKGLLHEKDKEIVSQSINQVMLTEFESRTITSLSDGEKQRASIARAFAQDTPIILLDEPTAHLDINNRIEILILLIHLAHDIGKTVLLSTHELELAIDLADKIWLMNKKEMHIGKPNELIENGNIQNIFHGKSYTFDATERRFIIKYTH